MRKHIRCAYTNEWKGEMVGVREGGREREREEIMQKYGRERLETKAAPPIQMPPLADAGRHEFLVDWATNIKYEFEWDTDGLKPVQTDAGVTGFAKVICRSCDDENAHAVGTHLRIHICRHVPCRARSKPTLGGPPVHFLRTSWRPDFVDVVACLPPTSSSALPAPAPTPPLASPALPALVTQTPSSPLLVQPPAPVSPTPAVQPPLVVPGSPASSRASACDRLVPNSMSFEDELLPAEDKERGLQPTSLSQPSAVDELCKIHQCALKERYEPGGGITYYCPSCRQPAAPEDVPEEFPKPLGAEVRYSDAAPPMPLESLEPTEREETVVAVAAPPLEHKTLSGNLLGNILKLAREIKTSDNSVGYIAFVCFAILNELRPFAWEGGNRIDLIASYAPWATRCTMPTNVDAVVCCVVCQDSGIATFEPVSDQHPLNECRHFLAAMPMHCPMDGGVGIRGYYNKLGMVLRDAVADGNCGLDVMCQMKGLQREPLHMNMLRTDIADFIIQNATEPWLHELMVATGELSPEELTSFRAMDSGVGGLAGAEKEITSDHLKALKCRTRIQDDAALASLARALPVAVLAEQLEMLREGQLSVAKPFRRQARYPVNPLLANLRMQVTKDRDAFLSSRDWDQDLERIPRNAWPMFVRADLYTAANIKRMKYFRRNVLIWHKLWQKDARHHAVGPKGRLSIVKQQAAQKRASEQLRRNEHSGRPYERKWLPRSLYKWWASLREDIDWKAVVASFDIQDEGSIRSGLEQKKALERYIRAMLKEKAHQLQQDHCVAALTKGIAPRTVNITSSWLRNWEAEFGPRVHPPLYKRLTMPLSVIGHRCETAWLNVARIRAFCMATHGYDPELESWDQLTLYHNETGSQETPTLAVGGAMVPLVKNHPSQRWTAMLTTFSNQERLSAGVPPYAEFVFKGSASLQSRLCQHVRGRGFDQWLTVRATESASYKTPEIIDFLTAQLPDMSSTRRWRIIIADGFPAHRSQAVFDLCWSRGYILVVLDGGITPVVHTCDTDLHQAVKREYVARQEIASVPSCTPECSIDRMAGVLMNMKLHRDAAEGYIKTGLAVPLDGSEDHKIVGEAGVLFTERDMRYKIRNEVAKVRVDCKSKQWRLMWSKENVQDLIHNCPKTYDHMQHIQINAVLRETYSDDTRLDDGERPHVDDDASCGYNDNNAADDAAGSASTDETGSSSVAVEEASGPPDHNAIDISTFANESVQHSADVVRVQEETIYKLKEIGQTGIFFHAVCSENERIRVLAQEDPEDALASTLQRNAKRARKGNCELEEEIDTLLEEEIDTLAAEPDDLEDF